MRGEGDKKHPWYLWCSGWHLEASGKQSRICISDREEAFVLEGTSVQTEVKVALAARCPGAEANAIYWVETNGGNPAGPKREDNNNENPVRTLNRRHVLLAGVKVGCGLIKNSFLHHVVGELIPTNRLAERSEMFKCFLFFFYKLDTIWFMERKSSDSCSNVECKWLLVSEVWSSVLPQSFYDEIQLQSTFFPLDESLAWRPVRR